MTHESSIKRPKYYRYRYVPPAGAEPLDSVGAALHAHANERLDLYTDI